MQLTRELIAIEEAGGGPAFDVQRHALQVRGVKPLARKPTQGN